MDHLTGRDPHTGHPITIHIREGRIASITEGPGKGAGSQTETAGYISPGLIDLQVNGFRGLDLNAETLTPATVIALTQALVKTGVTTYLPTLITQSEPRILAALQAIKTAREQNPQVAHIIAGIHIEGPSISPLDGPRGAHPLGHIRPPSLEEFTRWQQASNNLIKLVTLSPHFDEAPAYIAALRAHGVNVAIGHTHSTPEQVTAAVDSGANLSTHLGNGASATLPRHPNLLWTQLADDRLTATFIADGHHLPTDTLKSMLRAKTLANSILVSDLASLGGMPPGRYQQPIGGDVELSTTGRLSMADTTFLAGAALPLAANITHLLRTQHLTLAEALTLATTNPGRFLSHRGTLTIGAPADLIRFSLTPTQELSIETTLIQGQPWS